MPTIIQDSDKDLLIYCQQLRFCTIEHLTSLTNRQPSSINRRLQTLIAEKYIYRIKFDNPNHKHIYTLDSNGYFYLAQKGIVSIEEVPHRFRLSELKPLFLQHTLFITDLHTTFLLASRNSHLQLADWQEGKSIYDDVMVSDKGQIIRYPVCPDGFFTVKNTNRAEPNNRLAFVLEADRSTTTRRTFNEKMIAYSNYLLQEKQKEKFKVNWFRVVTVTLTNARAESLSNLARETVPDKLRKYFLFTSFENLSLEKPKQIFEPIFITPKLNEKVSLIP
jgi:hypothetical protein